MAITKLSDALGEPIRFRPARGMKAELQAYAEKLEAAAGNPNGVGISGAIRTILDREFQGKTPDKAYLAGFREGYARAYHETQAQISESLSGLSGLSIVPKWIGKKAKIPRGQRPKDGSDDTSLESETVDE